MEIYELSDEFKVILFKKFQQTTRTQTTKQIGKTMHNKWEVWQRNQKQKKLRGEVVSLFI